MPEHRYLLCDIVYWRPIIGVVTTITRYQSLFPVIFHKWIVRQIQYLNACTCTGLVSSMQLYILSGIILCILADIVTAIIPS